MRPLAPLLLLAAIAAAGPKENVPADAIVVNHFDFDALRKTAVWDRIAKPIGEFLGDAMGLQGLFEATGFQPETDLASLTFALGGDPVGGDEQIYVIARGKFDAKRFTEAMTKAGLKQTTRDGMTVFEDPDSKGKITCAFHGAFGLLDGALLFADPADGIDALRSALKEDAPRAEAAQLLAAAPDAHAWTVFAFPAALRKAMAEEPEGAPLAALKSGVVTYRAGARIDVAARAEAENAELAQQVLVVAQAALLGLGFGPQAKLECSGATLTGSLSLSLEELLTQMGMPVESLEQPGRSALPVVAEGAPALDGQGKLQCLTLPGVGPIAVSPDDRYVLAGRTLLDAELRVVGKAEPRASRVVCFAPDGRSAVSTEIGAMVVREIPGLRETGRLDYEQPGPQTAWAICRLPDRGGYVSVFWHGAGHEEGILRFRTDPLEWGPRGVSAIEHPIAGAVDPKTGLLVLIGDKTRCEVFDPQTMKSVATLDLPHPVTFDVVAAGGRAWIGTKAGVILPVDLATRGLLDPVRVADKGDVSLALSGSGQVLVAAAGRFVDGDHHPTRLVAYAVAAGGLRETAAAEFVAPCPCEDLAVLDDARMVVIGGREGFVWRYGPDGDD